MRSETVSLGKLFQIGSSKRVLKSQWKAEGVPFYRGREITRLAMDGFVENELFISENHYEELASQYGVPKAGDIVVTAIGTIGNSYIVHEGDRFYFKDASVLWMKKSKDVSSQFVNFWLKSPFFLDQLDRGNGATVDTLTIQKLQTAQIRIPPLSEQRRIVAILDEAFEGIATAKANAEKNLQNAREVFESHLNAVFSHAWETYKIVTLSELSDEITDGDHMPPPKSTTGIPFITIGNIKKDTRTIDFSETFKVANEYFCGLKPNKKPQAGDILYTVTGSFGIPVLIRGKMDFCFQRHIGLIRPKSGIKSDWLYYLLMSPQVFKQADFGATGTAQKTVSLKVLRGFRVPLVPLAQQMVDICAFDSIFEETQHLESIYQQKLSALDELKQSLLHQAFNGDL